MAVKSKKNLTIKSTEFARRRKRLMSLMDKNSIAILASADEQTRSRDTHYRFRQDSDFFYLTGFNEPSAVAVLIPNRKQGQFILFCRNRDPQMEIWDGKRSGPEGAVNDFQADDAFPIDDIDEILPGLIEGKDKIYYALGNNAGFDHQIIEWVNVVKTNTKRSLNGSAQLELVDLQIPLHDLRLFKSTAEIKVMREAAKISAEAHTEAMRAAEPGKSETDIEGVLTTAFYAGGAREHAYSAIVAGGENACILHYIDNDAELKDGDLLLIDAGCELQNYASDISRTFPINGKFTPAQAAIYEVVLRAQEAAIATVKPGKTWEDPHQAAVRALTEGLVELGILKGQVNKLIESEAYKAFYMHKTGHWLGMDVHDVGEYRIGGQPRVLEPGMVLTVEPGIYIAPGTKKVAKKWHGIGVRIEDDVLVTKTGHEVLSRDVPKSIVEIEALMQRQ